MHFGLICAALVLLVAAAYSNSTSNGFVWDDHEQILLNPAVKPGSPLSPIFTTDARFGAHSQMEQGKDYRPLQMLAYRLLFSAVGPQASAFHMLSILFAMAGTLAAFGVFWKLTRRLPVAAAAAALFAVNPLHTEAVDWIAALGDLGFALFVLFAFFCYLSAVETGQRLVTTNSGRWTMGGLSVLAFATALLWKETAVIFPLLLLACELLLGVGESAAERAVSALRRSSAYWVVLAGYLAMRIGILGGLSLGSRDWELGPFEFLLNALSLMVRYWAKLLWPADLNAYTTFLPIRSVTDTRAVLAVAVALAAAVAIAAWIRQPARLTAHGRRAVQLALFSAAWVLLALLPAMNLGALGRNAFTERYLYLPSAGFSLLVVLFAAWVLQRVPARLRSVTGTAVLLVVVGCFIVETVTRNPDWKDNATLFSATLLRSPDAPFVRNMVAADESSNPADATHAEENYRQSIALAKAQMPPDRVDEVVAYQGMASVLSGRREFEQALQMLAEARKIEPNDADTDGQMGMILAQKGDGKDAEPLLEHALAASPNNENVLSALGLVARDNLHEPQRAVSFFQRALAIQPEQDDFAASQHNNLAAAYNDKGDLLAATKELRQALAILPNDLEFHVNLAGLLAEQGDLTHARMEARTALQLAPNDGAARAMLEQLNDPPR